MFIFYNQIKHRQPQGQIAVLLVLIIAIIFLFMVITMNISHVSQMNTAMANAADGAALLLASYLSSWGRIQWGTVLKDTAREITDPDGKKINVPKLTMQQSEINNYVYCKVAWQKVLASIGLAVSIFLAQWMTPVMAAISVAAAALSLGLTLAVFTPKMDAVTETVMQNYYNKLSQKEQMIEGTIDYALSAIVDDPNLVTDVHDIDADGDTTDLIPAFEFWKMQRLSDLVKAKEPITPIREQIEILYNIADPFRKYCAGEQEYPELLESPEWVKLLKLKEGSDVTENNNYYPLDGVFMKLLGDLANIALPKEAEALKKAGEKKEPISIDNLDIVENKDSDTGYDLIPYEEQFIYKVNFWQHDALKEKDLATVLERLLDPSCHGDLFTPGAGHKINAPPACLDQVDYLALALTKFRFWAHGLFNMEPVDGPEAKPGPIDPVRGPQPLPESSEEANKRDECTVCLRGLYNCLKECKTDTCDQGCVDMCPDCGVWSGHWEGPWFHRGVTQLSDNELLRSYDTWIRQLINIDDANPTNQIESYKLTFTGQFEFWANMLAGFASRPDYSKGWLAELEKVRCTEKWQTKYKVKGEITSKDGFVGKRKELAEKMEKICSIYNNLRDKFSTGTKQFGYTINPGGYCVKDDGVTPDSWTAPSCGDCTIVTKHKICGGDPFERKDEDLTSYNRLCLLGQIQQFSDRLKHVNEIITALEKEIKKKEDRIEAIKKEIADLNVELLRLQKTLTDCVDACEDACDRACTKPEGCTCDCDCNRDEINAACNAIVDRINNVLNKEWMQLIEDLKWLNYHLACRKSEVERLDIGSGLLDEMISLAVTFNIVTNWNNKVETAEDRIVQLWRALKGMYSYITDTTLLDKLSKLNYYFNNGQYIKNMDELKKYIRSGNFDGYKVIYSWKTKDQVTGGKEEIKHAARVIVSDFNMPTLTGAGGECNFFSEVGAKLDYARGDIYVSLGRFDEDKNLALGGKTTWLNWLFKRTVPSTASKTENWDWLISGFGFKAHALAHYSPCLECRDIHTHDHRIQGGLFLHQTSSN